MADDNGAPEQRPANVQQIQEPEGLQPLYANFCRVASTPEELVLDFGLNPHPFGTSAQPVKVTERLVVNYYTAKRMWAALGLALQRHEQAFGVIETDVNKRASAMQTRTAQRTE
jgi:hypothetical protein